MHWIHFIGTSDYTEKSFVADAERHGASRRTSMLVAKQMEWGDVIHCAIFRKGEKSAVLFGEFVVERIAGITDEARIAIEENFKTFSMPRPSVTVYRECGSYTTGPTLFVTDAPIPRITEFLESTKSNGADIGIAMLQGAFTQYAQAIRIHRIKYARGFRRFNWDKCTDDAFASGRLETRHHYYVDNPERAIRTDTQLNGEVQVVRHYHRQIRSAM